MIEVEDFVSEARDCLEVVGARLLTLETTKDPEDLNAVFRAIHTVKGCSGFLNVAPLTKLLHVAEDVLSAARRGELAVDGRVVDALLRATDIVSRWVDVLGETSRLPDGAEAESSDILAELVAIRTASARPAPEATRQLAKTITVEELPPSLATVIGESPDELSLIRYTPSADCVFRGLDPVNVALDLPGIVALDVRGPTDWGDLADLAPHHCRLTFDVVVRAQAGDIEAALEWLEGEAVTMRIVSRSALAAAAVPAPLLAAAPDPSAPRVKTAATTLRVAPEKVDALMNLVGELVVAKNALHHLARTTADESVARGLHEQHAVFDRLAEALQGAVMQMRMMPVESVFQRFPRLVRDLGRELGKSVELTFDGEDTEADRTVIERLSEPITHLVRNSLDHGLEGPEEREAKGKPRTGTLRLAAQREVDQLVISLTDDGRGVDSARVGKRAVERGLVDDSTLASMSEAAIVELIFAPGFSTAAAVSSVSGRGVGMDAVKRDVEGLGGKVTLENHPGRGMSVHLVLPIAMAFTRVLVVRTAEERYGIPFDCVEGVTKVPLRSIRTGIGGGVIEWRKALVPVIELDATLGGPARSRSADDVRALLIVRVGAQLVALAVDGFEADFDVVVKPMSGVLANLPAVAGSAILGDGKVLLVLDPKEIVACARDSKMAA